MSILALTANTLAGTAGAGQLEYDGQFYATDSNSSRGQIERLVQGIAVASTSGTSIDFTGIPAWAKRITVMLNGVSTNGTSSILVQLGSGSPTTTGYLGTSSFISSTVSSSNLSTGFLLFNWVLAANVGHGSIVFTNITGNTWVASGAVGLSNVANTITVNGSIALAGVLDRVRLTTVAGTDTFDAGSINIMYEG